MGTYRFRKTPTPYWTTSRIRAATQTRRSPSVLARREGLPGTTSLATPPTIRPLTFPCAAPLLLSTNHGPSRRPVHPRHDHRSSVLVALTTKTDERSWPGRASGG